MGKEKGAKPKKEKIVYIDDGSTVADMSSVSRRPKKQQPSSSQKFARDLPKKSNWPESKLPNQKLRTGRGTRREQMNTYLSAVRMMIIPMLVTLGIIGVVFLLLWLLMGI